MTSSTSRRNEFDRKRYNELYRSMPTAFGEGLRDGFKQLVRDGYHEGCKSILDIGCGQGQLLHALGHMGFEFGIGIEPAFEGARAARVLFEDSGLKGGIINAEFPIQLNRRFDIVTSVFILHHVPESGRGQFVEAAMQLADMRLVMLMLTSYPNNEGVLTELPFARSLKEFVEARGWAVPLFETERSGKVLFGDNTGKEIRCGTLVAERRE